MLTTEICVQIQQALKLEWSNRINRPGVNAQDQTTAEGLSLRVVNQSSKKVEVKDQFRKAFRDQNGYVAFPYTQKVMLLFQKIEGVDVLLMVIYVQVRLLLVYMGCVLMYRPMTYEKLNTCEPSIDTIMCEL